jgi:dCMP deaminase
MKRPGKIESYLNVALTISQRSPCLRRRFGAVIVKDDAIISTGYNGPARGAPNCVEHGCLKNEKGVAPGLAYDFCRAGPLHAEVNAIINAARHGGGTVGSTIYIAGEYADGRGLSDSLPCIICEKEIINAGIEKIVIGMADGKFKEFFTKDLVAEASNTKDKNIVSFY